MSEKSTRIAFSILVAVVIGLAMSGFETMPVLFVIWIFCILAEEKITLKSIFTVLYIPAALALGTVLLAVIAVIIVFLFPPDSGISTGIAAGFALSLIVIGMYILLIALRSRNNVRLLSPGFLICAALSAGICLYITIKAVIAVLSLPRPLDYMSILSIQSEEKHPFLNLLMYYLPSLGILLSRPEAENTEDEDTEEETEEDLL